MGQMPLDDTQESSEEEPSRNTTTWMQKDVMSAAAPYSAVFHIGRPLPSTVSPLTFVIIASIRCLPLSSLLRPLFLPLLR